jgi:hypothetical protein
MRHAPIPLPGSWLTRHDILITAIAIATGLVLAVLAHQLLLVLTIPALWIYARAVWAYPLLALLAYVFLIPSENLGIIAGNLTVIKVVGGLGAGLVMARMVLQGERWRIPWLAAPTLAFIAVSAGSWLAAGRPSFGQQLLLTLLMVTAGTFVLGQTIRTPRDLRLVLIALALASAFYGFLYTVAIARSGILTPANCNILNAIRKQMIIGDPNYLCIPLVSGVLASLYLALDEQRVAMRGIWMGALALASMGTVMTFSRTGLLLLIPGLLILGFLFVRTGRARLLLGITLFLIGMGITLVAIRPLACQYAFLARLTGPLAGAPTPTLTGRASPPATPAPTTPPLAGAPTPTLTGSEVSLLGRLWAVQAGLAMWRDHPLLGVGLGQFQFFYARYRPPTAVVFERLVAHNSTISVLAESGIFAFLSYVGLQIMALIMGVRLVRRAPPHLRRMSITVLAILLVVLAAGGALDTHYTKMTWLGFLLVWRASEAEERAS